ncbi:MAG: CinA family nicotinamide mononucleotide deamidase-related protein [Dehalococcoidales bacterium]|nr:CinA family nicotinamide mononucleotide deamidase-related protein [Dehalococcoidales bacterium]
MAIRNQAEIISIGTEIMMGEITDTNAGYLATQLHLLGVEAGRVTVSGDDRMQLIDIFRQALARTDLIISTGGLGPTDDDLTRECLAEALVEELTINAGLEQELRAIFARMHRDMPLNNLRQAMLIPSGRSIPNPRGTAPGWWVEKDGKIIVILPGPPREMHPMWLNDVKPELQRQFAGKIVLTRTIKVYGLGEAKVNEMIASFFKPANPTLGIYAKPDGIHLRLIARGNDARRLIETTGKQITNILTANVWGYDEDTLPGVIGKLMTEKKLKLAVFDDGTRGVISTLLSQAENAKMFFKGGLLAPDNNVKTTLGVPSETISDYGTISSQVAEKMAGVVKEKFATDIGLSITGMGGLDEDKTADGECFIGLADARGEISFSQRLLPHRDNMRNLAAIAALFRLRQLLLET